MDKPPKSPFDKCPYSRICTSYAIARLLIEDLPQTPEAQANPGESDISNDELRSVLADMELVEQKGLPDPANCGLPKEIACPQLLFDTE